MRRAQDNAGCDDGTIMCAEAIALSRDELSPTPGRMCRG